jgi:hypothetical protein
MCSFSVKKVHFLPVSISCAKSEIFQIRIRFDKFGPNPDPGQDYNKYLKFQSIKVHIFSGLGCQGPDPQTSMNSYLILVRNIGCDLAYSPLLMDCVVRRAEDCDGQRQLARGGHQVPQGGGRGLLHHAQQGTLSNHQTLELSKNTPRFDVYFPSGGMN